VNEVPSCNPAVSKIKKICISCHYKVLDFLFQRCTLQYLISRYNSIVQARLDNGCPALGVPHLSGFISSHPSPGTLENEPSPEKTPNKARHF